MNLFNKLLIIPTRIGMYYIVFVVKINTFSLLLIM